LFKFCTILSYANSSINPFLYAFTNDAYKSAFADAFACVGSTDKSRDVGAGVRRDDGADGAGNHPRVDEAQPTVPDYHIAGRSPHHDNAIQLEMTTKQSQLLQTRQANELVTTADYNDVHSCRLMHVVVHLEEHQQHQQQQQQPQRNESDATADTTTACSLPVEP